jgi:DNA integrity scanning protein DisA with diadenylate cyclase activity
VDTPLGTLPLDWRHAVDLVVLTFTLYAVLLWAQRNRALRMALAIVSLLAAAGVTSSLGLTITGRVMQGASLVALLMLLLLFQPEIRHGLVSLDRALSRRGKPRAPLASVHQAIGEAAFALAQARLGALIVVARRGPLSEEVAQGGTPLGARVSSELLESLFLKGSRLHDGAAVVEGDRITRAGVFLPTTSRTDIPSRFGSRHRAAAGMAECCDALVITVSEERGEVHLVDRRRFSRVESAAALFQALQDLQDETGRRPPLGIRHLALAQPGLAILAAALAGLMWLGSLLMSGGR